MSIRKQSLSQAVNYSSILLLPLASLYISLRNFRRPEARNLFWLFCTFYGITHIVFNARGYYIDSVAYALDFMRICRIHSLSDLSTYIAESNKIDLYVTTISFIVSRLTDNYHILFLIFACIFGYFYSRNIWFILERIEVKTTTALCIYIAFFLLLIPIWQINGRMWTAAHIFFYGVIQYLLYHKKGALVWCAVSLFVHFSFIFPALIALLFLFLPKKPTPYVYLLVVSMCITSINMDALNNLLNNILPDMYENKINAYVNTEYASKLATSFTQTSLKLQMQTYLFSIVPNATLILFYLKGKRLWQANPVLKNLLCFSALFSAAAGIASLVPSSSRFLYVAYLFNIAYIIMVKAELMRQGIKNSPASTMLEYIMLLCMVYMCLFFIRLGLMFIGISFFISTPFSCWFINDNIPIMQYGFWPF